MWINVIYYDVYHMLTLSKTYYIVIVIVIGIWFFFSSPVHSLAFAQFIVHHQIIRIEFIVHNHSLLLLFLLLIVLYLHTSIQHSFAQPHLLARINVTEGNQSFGQCTLIQWHLTLSAGQCVWVCFTDRFSHPCLMMICKWFSGWHANFVDAEHWIGFANNDNDNSNVKEKIFSAQMSTVNCMHGFSNVTPIPW